MHAGKERAAQERGLVHNLIAKLGGVGSFKQINYSKKPSYRQPDLLLVCFSFRVRDQEVSNEEPDPPVRIAAVCVC